MTLNFAQFWRPCQDVVGGESGLSCTGLSGPWKPFKNIALCWRIRLKKLLGACGDPSLPPHDSHHRRCFLHPRRASLSLGHWGHSCRLHQARPLWRQHNYPQHLRRVSYRYTLWSSRSNSVMIIPAWSGFSPPSPLVASTTLPTLTSASSMPSRCCGGCSSQIISDLFWKLIHVRKKVLFHWYPWRRFVMIAPPPHQLKLLKYLMMR